MNSDRFENFAYSTGGIYEILAMADRLRAALLHDFARDGIPVCPRRAGGMYDHASRPAFGIRKACGGRSAEFSETDERSGNQNLSGRDPERAACNLHRTDPVCRLERSGSPETRQRGISDHSSRTRSGGDRRTSHRQFLRRMAAAESSRRLVTFHGTGCGAAKERCRTGYQSGKTCADLFQPDHL